MKIAAVGVAQSFCQERLHNTLHFLQLPIMTALLRRPTAPRIGKTL